MMFRRGFLLPILMALSACGGGGDDGTSGGEDELGDMIDEPIVAHRGSAIETLGITGPTTPWAEMSRMDREMYMVGKVMPIMNELFVRQYGTRYPETGITCATCHGPDGEARGFAMPSGSILALPAFGTPGMERMQNAMPDSFRFMSETVGPTMATLLGMPEYRCSGCHVVSP